MEIVLWILLVVLSVFLGFGIVLYFIRFAPMNDKIELNTPDREHKCIKLVHLFERARVINIYYQIDPMTNRRVILHIGFNQETLEQIEDDFNTKEVI